MDNNQITEALQDIFDEKKHRIVFWYDGEQEFSEILHELGIDGVHVLRIDEPHHSFYEFESVFTAKGAIS